jgi:hypothetical protein
MSDITNPRLLYAKVLLFVVLGLLAGSLILYQHPEWQLALLLAIAIWAFCRAYYFVFYVIEHYIDPGYRFAGLSSVLRYLLTSRESRGDATRQKIDP